MTNTTTGKTVRFTLDPNTPLSEEDQAMLARLAAMPDSEIDFSDIPATPPGTKWYRRGELIPDTK